MRVKQFIGPFPSGPLNLGIGNHRIVQIGIECPHSPLLFPWWDSDTKKYLAESVNQKIVLNINDQSYSIGESDILEFENLYSNDISIIVQEIKNPYLTINIAYE